jgi:hypothetical protein
VHGSQNPQRSVTPSWCEASKTFNPEIKQLPANALTNIHSQHIMNTHRHAYKTEHMQEKLLLFILKMENACLYKGVLELSLALSLYSSPNSK